MVVYLCVLCTASANHPSLQPEGRIAKGAAQRDWPNAYHLLSTLTFLVADFIYPESCCRTFGAVGGKVLISLAPKSTVSLNS